jgi:hypothetical protein
MLTDRALANFRRFIAANPNGPRHNPAGAFDSMPPQLSRHFSRHRGIPISAFEKGGAFDEGGDTSALNTLDEGQVSALLIYLSGKLSDADLEALRELLNQNAQSAAIEKQPTVSGSDARLRRLAADIMIRRDGRQRSRATEMFPELARIKLG